MTLFLFTALAPVLWGSTYMLTSLYLPADTPLWVATFRALPVGVLMVLLAMKPLPKGWYRRMLLLGGINISAFFALLFVAAYRLPGGVAATLLATLPLLALLFQWLAQGQRHQPLQWLAALVGLLGVAVLVLSPAAQLDLLGIAAAFGACLMVLSGTLLIQRWGVPIGLIPFTGWQLLLGGLLLLPLAYWAEGLPPALNETHLAGLLWLGLVNTALGYLIWFRGVSGLATNQLAFLSLLSPVTAVVLGVGWVGETLSGWQWLAVAVILLSLPLVQFSSRKRVAEPA
ncbi:EamA family transporter [Marinobacterium arenosum]|uniref:EamA family transporter n=1 Tax=Marinobacterium arenosum TaxID=2862496 RepID=UPI001C965FFD|nr:EamA family transporter [Marinobacterium arenosum]MBY4675792.1 EamA family transporter [Marinobacterium arenosum]